MEQLKTVRAIRAAFLARSVTSTETLQGLLGLALPRATAFDLMETWAVERRGY